MCHDSFTVRPSSSYKRRWDARTHEQYYEHRALASWRLGRPLRPGEVVHHVDGDPTNNHPDNLRVLPSQRHHMLLEHYQWREQQGVHHLFPIEQLLIIL